MKGIIDKQRAKINQLKKDVKVVSTAYDRKKKQYKSISKDYDQLQAEEKVSHIRIGELFKFE